MLARSAALDVLRVVAISAVLFYHLGLHADWQSTRHGWMGVDLFFVLSGLLIGGQLFSELLRSKTLALGRFYARRAWRILPSYLVVVAVYALVPALRENPGLPPVWKFLTFTQNFGLRIDQTGAFIHAWSLCVEEHFYVVLPLLALVWRGRKRTIGLLAALLAIACFIRFFIWRTLGGEVAEPVLNEYLYYPTFSHYDGLVYGVALALVRVYRPSWWTVLRRYPLVNLAVSIVAITLACLCDDVQNTFAATFQLELVSLGCATLVLAAMSDFGERLLAKVPLAATGASLAFTLYLTHQLVFHVCSLQIPAPYGAPGVAITIVCTIAAAAVLHVCIERPGLLLRDRVRGRFLHSPLDISIDKR